MNVSICTFALCVSALAVRAKAGGGNEAPVFDPARSGVQVVFAPASEEEPFKTARAVVYPARAGATGMRLETKSMVGTFITIGTDGTLQMVCAPFPEAVRKLEASKAARQPAVQGTSHEK